MTTREAMRLNMGSGFNKLDGYVNCDIMPECKPDITMDMEQLPWPFESDSAEEILFNHSLEHVGQLREKFISIVQEIYRVAKHGAQIKINVPNPNHPDFLGDPTHVRPITPQMLVTFDQAVNADWIKRGLPGTPMGKYAKVDFETIKFVDHQGVWYEITLIVRKLPHTATEEEKTVTLCRYGGLGDVALMLAAAKAIKMTKGWRVNVITTAPYEKLAKSCPYVDAVSTQPDLYGSEAVTNLNFASFGQSSGHQLDNYLKAIGVDADARDKSLNINSCKRNSAQVARIPRGKKRVLLHAGLTDPNRSWPSEHWKALAEMLVKAEYLVTWIGKADAPDGRSVHEITVEGTEDKTSHSGNHDSLIDLICLMDDADLLVSCDSGPIQLAGSTDIGIVGIYSVVSGKQRLPYRHGELGWNAVAIEPDCPYHPCYGHMTLFPKTDLGEFFAKWCPQESEYGCMKSITPPRVFNAVLDLLGE